MAKGKSEGEVRSESFSETKVESRATGINESQTIGSGSTVVERSETRPNGNGTQVSNGQRPDKVFKAKGVRVSLFRNRTNDGQREFWKLSVQKIYKEGNEFKTTNSIGRDDVPVTRHLLQLGWAYILESEASWGYEE